VSSRRQKRWRRGTLAQQSHRAACGPGGLRRSAKNRSGRSSIPRVRVLTSLHHAPKGPKQVSPGQSEAAAAVAPPWVNGPPEVLRPERARQVRDVVRIKRHRSQRRAPLSFHPLSSILTEFRFISISWLCRPFRAGGFWFWNVFVFVLGACSPRVRFAAAPRRSARGYPVNAPSGRKTNRRTASRFPKWETRAFPFITRATDRDDRRPHQPSRGKRPVSSISRAAPAAGSPSAEPRKRPVSRSAEPRQRPVLGGYRPEPPDNDPCSGAA
jgi:hypothetical protein